MDAKIKFVPMVYKSCCLDFFRQDREGCRDCSDHFMKLQLGLSRPCSEFSLLMYGHFCGGKKKFNLSPLLVIHLQFGDICCGGTNKVDINREMAGRFEGWDSINQYGSMVCHLNTSLGSHEFNLVPSRELYK